MSTPSGSGPSLPGNEGMWLREVGIETPLETLDDVEANGNTEAVSRRAAEADALSDWAPEDLSEAANKRRSFRWLPALTVVAVACASMLRTGVSAIDLALYAGYWVVCLVVPGVLVFRALVGPRPYFIEDLALGAATGLALEHLSWRLLEAVGAHGLVRWWWVSVYLAALLLPQVRAGIKHRSEKSMSLGWAWSMATIISLLIVIIDVYALRAYVLPPSDSAVFVDMWWHLSLIQELMSDAPHYLPQVAMEPLDYHFGAHVNMAIGANVTGVAPEILLFRLWPIPIVATTAILVAALARDVTRQTWAGPAAAAISLMFVIRPYLWLDQNPATNYPLPIHSPSQIIANPFVVAIGLFCVWILRRRVSARTWAWIALLVLTASAAKTTVLPILIAGLTATIVYLLVVDRQRLWQVVALLALASGVLFVTMSQTSVDWGGRITLFGSLREHPYFVGAIGRFPRAVNDGLVLDTLTDARSWMVAGAVLLFWVGTSAIRLIGLGSLAVNETRRDPVTWFMASAYLSGWAAAMLVDHAGLSQNFFMHTGSFFGSVLTVWLIATLLSRAAYRSHGVIALAAGGALGGLTHWLIGAVVRERTAVAGDAYGALESFATPLVVVSVVGSLAAISWYRLGRQRFVSVGLLVAVGATLGLAVPGHANRYLDGSLAWTRSYAAPPVNPDNPYFSSAAEQEGLLWLRDHAGDDDIMIVNYHCTRPAVDSATCVSRGFWTTGISGLTAVLETWAYTPQAQRLHNQNGLHYDRQPTPWPDRLQMSNEVFENPSTSLLDTLKEQFSADWVVALKDSGPVSPALADLVELAFENEGITIYRIS